MSFSMQKLRALLPSQHASSANAAHQKQQQQQQQEPVVPEVGFRISIEMSQQQQNNVSSSDVSNSAGHHQQPKATVPELNVQLIAARHLPSLFGFKIVQGYLIKVKLFPGSKRLDSTIQTNSWPKFNENFRFPLAPDLKPSMKHSSRRGSKTVSEFTPEELFAGQFVVFTVYALLELPPASFNRFNKTYRSLRDKSSNLVQKVVESSSGKSKDDKENSDAPNGGADTQKSKRKSSSENPRDAIPPLTISESRRNIGSVTCYLEPKIFTRNTRSGFFSTEELWLPIKDITTTLSKTPSNNLANATKGVVEIALEVRDLSDQNSTSTTTTTTREPSITPSTPPPTPTTPNTNGVKNPQWNRMTSEVKRKMGISNLSKTAHNNNNNLVLRITTARMRCSNKVKDELEGTAGSVYVKTTVFEHGIYIDAWKSPNFYPSLSTKWDVGVGVGGDDDLATLTIPLQSVESLENILIRTTLATKTKMGKKLVLGTVMVGVNAGGSGAEQMTKMLSEAPLNERVPMWHSYQ